MSGQRRIAALADGAARAIRIKGHCATRCAPASLENAPYKALAPCRRDRRAMRRRYAPRHRPAMACRPSRAAFGVSLIAVGPVQVRPPSVDRHTIRSPGSLAIALTTMALPLMTTRGPRCRPSIIFGKSATLDGALKFRPLSSERASQMPSPEPKTSATVPPAAASCGCRFRAVGDTAGKCNATSAARRNMPSILPNAEAATGIRGAAQLPTPA